MCHQLVSVLDRGARVGTFDMAVLVALPELGIAPARLITQHKPSKT